MGAAPSTAQARPSTAQARPSTAQAPPPGWLAARASVNGVLVLPLTSGESESPENSSSRQPGRHVLADTPVPRERCDVALRADGGYAFVWATGEAPRGPVLCEYVDVDKLAAVDDVGKSVPRSARPAVFVPAASADEARGSSRLRVPLGASRLSREALCDRVRGVVFGNALGDAVGLATEFFSRDKIASAYGGTPNFFNDPTAFSFDAFYDDRHRAHFVRADWTDDTDQMIALLESFLCHDGELEPTDVARRLLYWSRNGFPELHDVCGLGMGRLTNTVLSDDAFLERPLEAAQRARTQIFNKTGAYPRANGGVMRTAITGVPAFHDLESVARVASLACRVTHADPQCVASCVGVATIVALMLAGADESDGSATDPASTAGRERVAQRALNAALAHLHSDDAADDADAGASALRAYALAPTLEALSLDTPAEIGYTFKCMGAGFWALRADVVSPAHALLNVAAAGGDADTNGAVAGAVLGARFGYRALPHDWLEQLPFAHWLHLRVDYLLVRMGLLDRAEDGEAPEYLAAVRARAARSSVTRL